MPKKQQQTKYREQHDTCESHSFHGVIATTLTSGASLIQISPNSFPRVTTLADTYALYRFRDLKFRILPDTAITAMQSAVFQPGVVDTVPANVAAAMQGLNAVALPIRQVVPTNWVELNQKDLASYTPWLKTAFGTVDPDQEIQGNIFLNGTGSEVVTVELRGVVDFKNPINTGSTPEVRARLVAAEKKRLLNILSAPDVSPTMSATSVVATKLPKP